MKDIKQALYVKHVLDLCLYSSIDAGVSPVVRATLALFHATKSSSMVGQA